MASFCSVCSEQMFGDQVEVDYDIPALFESLKPGNYIGWMLCEGCTICAIRKTEEGECMAAYYDSEGEYLKWVKYDWDNPRGIPGLQI